MSPIQISLSQTSGPLRETLRQILGDALVSAKPSIDVVVGLAIPVLSDGSDWPDRAAEILERHPNCVGLVVAGQGAQNDCEGLRPGLRHSFWSCARFITLNEPDLLRRLLEQTVGFRDNPPNGGAMMRAREVIFAKALHCKLVDFSHGGRDDITNQFLAPARLGIALGFDQTGLLETTRNLREKFVRTVLVPARNLGALGGELRTAYCQTLKSLRSSRPEEATLQRLMDLLTECRETAGTFKVPKLATESPRSGPAFRNDVFSPEGYRILVIDDHYENWRPVLEQLASETSADLQGAKVVVENGPLKLDAAVGRAAGHDLVLLDIFLGQDGDGLSILQSIRQHYVNLPVILWTSSRQIELPAEARLAHGFLFKKSSTKDEIVTTLARHLREGRARRLYPLTGHFFDQSILSEHNRKIALRMAEYCSKQLDSFHALDDRYFRFFTDHGGRHLLKLVEFLGEILRPLTNDSGIFSQEPNQREEEILALYLAVFLHEFGMLRLPDPHEPSLQELISKATQPGENRAKSRAQIKLGRELSLVRVLHAVRGMVMLSKDPTDTPNMDHHWPDDEGRHQAWKRLWKGRSPFVRTAVALITGHHSRLLPLGSRGDCWDHLFQSQYLKKAADCWFGYSKKAAQKLASDCLEKRFYSQRVVADVLQSLLKNITEEDRVERVRKHCAIFRFVDAIDVDHTRNPARFLCRATMISPIDRRETLKRQVLRKVWIEGGIVQMQTNVPPPSEELVNTMFALVKPKEAESKVREIILSAIINLPWENVESTESVSLRVDCHKDIDNWLAGFWRAPKTTLAPFLKRSRGILTDNSKLAVASLTALSVAWEILSEYQAILDCGLQQHILLGSFWRDDNKIPSDWLSHQKDMLAILFDPKDGIDGL